jgi:hypothetical protein
MKLLSQRFACAHSIQVNSCGDGVRLDANFFGPIAQVLCPPIMGKQSGATTVSYLLGLRGPLAIFWEVAKVVVYSLKGKAGRALAHIGKEVFERFQPSVADRNAPTAIASIPFVVGVEAPAFHVSPRFVHSRSFAYSGVPVRGIVDAGKLAPIAPAGLNKPGTQRRSGYYFLPAAVTQAEPSTVFSSLGQSLNNKSSESLANKSGYVSAHALHYSMRTVDDHWQQGKEQ